MNKIIKYGAIAVVAVLAIIGIVSLVSKSNLVGDASTGFPNGISVGGGTYAVSPALAVTGGTKVGATGTSFTQMNGGICYIQAYATTITASTSVTVDCQGTAAVGGITTAFDTALVGVQNNDNVIASFSTTTAGTVSTGVDIVGASASSTAGYITLRIANSTGGTYTWPTTGTATGTVSYITFR